MLRNLYTRRIRIPSTCLYLDREQSIGHMKKSERDKHKSVRTTDLCRRRHHTKSAEGVVQQSFIDVLVQISNEQIGPDVKLLLIRRCLVSEKHSIVRMTRGM